jgi:LmeA-like phospholipid-binding
VLRRLIVLGVVLLVIIVALLVVSDVVAEPAVERRLAQEIQERYGLVERPDVNIDAFPFLVDAGRGQLDRVEVNADEFRFGGLTVARVELDLLELHYSVGDVLADREAAWAERVEGVAEVSQAALNQYLVDNGFPYAVTLMPGQVDVAGAVTVAGQTVNGTATVELSIVEGALQFRATNAQAPGLALDPAVVAEVAQRFTFAVPIPEVIGVRLTDIEVAEGSATLRAEALNYQVMGG